MLLTVTMREARRGQNEVEQQAGQREVAEVVHAELALEALRGLAVGRRHDAGVVDQQVQAVVSA